MKFVVMPELRGRWSWELRRKDGALVAASAMSFASRDRTLASIQEFRNVAAQALLVDSEGRCIDGKRDELTLDREHGANAHPTTGPQS